MYLFLKTRKLGYLFFVCNNTNISNFIHSVSWKYVHTVSPRKKSLFERFSLGRYLSENAKI